MKNPGDAIDLFFDSYRLSGDRIEGIPKALIVLSEALLAIAESNEKIADANKCIAEAIEGLSKEDPYSLGPLRVIAEAMKQIARKE
jgi:hypothetical protein